MSEQVTLSPSEATDKLFSQFSQESETLQTVTEAAGSRTEAIARITSVVASSFFSELPDIQAQHEYLVSWHHLARWDCSRTYARLSENNPSADRSSVNQNNELQILNGIRQGVHRALVVNHRRIQSQSRHFRLSKAHLPE